MERIREHHRARETEVKVGATAGIGAGRRVALGKRCLLQRDGSSTLPHIRPAERRASIYGGEPSRLCSLQAETRRCN